MKLTKEQAALQALRNIAKKLPGAEEYVMVHHPAFRVGKKPFLIAGMNAHEIGPTVSINLGPEAQGHLLGDERFSKTPYIGQHGWVTVPQQALGAAELSALVIDSYRRIAGKKLLAELTGDSKTSTAQASKGKNRAKRARPAATTEQVRDERTWDGLTLSGPARRALRNAGFESLRDLSRTTESSLRELHGLGPKGIRLLAAAMAKAKVRFARD
jgi:predicted DNA-binding protein (MmcQ/YjbR family)